MSNKFIEVKQTGDCYDKVFLINLPQLICIEFVISKTNKNMNHEIVYTTKDNSPIIEYFDNETELDKFNARCKEIRKILSNNADEQALQSPKYYHYEDEYLL